MLAIGGVVGAWSNVDHRVGRQVTRARIALAVLPCRLLAGTPAASGTLRAAADELDLPPPHPMDS